jgi:hypothetical protein
LPNNDSSVPFAPPSAGLFLAFYQCCLAEKHYCGTAMSSETRMLEFVATKLSRALITAHCASTIQEGVFTAHNEGLQWLASVDNVPPSLQLALQSLYADLATRVAAVESDGLSLTAMEAWSFVDRLEDALALAIVALQSRNT